LGWRGRPRPSRTAPLGMTKTPTLQVSADMLVSQSRALPPGPPLWEPFLIASMPPDPTWQEQVHPHRPHGAHHTSPPRLCVVSGHVVSPLFLFWGECRWRRSAPCDLSNLYSTDLLAQVFGIINIIFGCANLLSLNIAGIVGSVPLRPTHSS